MNHRTFFDTNSVISALLFEKGRLCWLRAHWCLGRCVPLVCCESVLELTRVLTYPKFRLTADDQKQLLRDYLPYAESVDLNRRCTAVCRDSDGQFLLDLAERGLAGCLVSGDRDLLALAGKTRFAIETPEAHRIRCDVCE